MAMASGTDPLDRLQVGARALRAERERCHAAADRACRAESGEAFSTIRGGHGKYLGVDSSSNSSSSEDSGGGASGAVVVAAMYCE